MGAKSPKCWKMKRIKLLLLLPFFFTSLTIYSQSVKPDSKAKMEMAIQNLTLNDGTIRSVEKAMAEEGLPSLSVVVFENYKIAWSKTWGVKDLISKEPIDENTAFSTASISKAITATLFAILEEKELIDLGAPVSNYLKRWQFPDNEFTEAVDITFNHLLSHTAGTTQHGFKDFYEGDEIPTLVQVLEGGSLPGTSKMDVDFLPGSWWRYSGGGYVIAQMALEDHLGAPLADIAEKHLFGPLQLQNTTMKQDGEKGFLKNVAKAHNENGEVYGIPICPQLAPSGLWSNPTDMAIFMIEMQKALKGLKTEVISTEVAKKVTGIMTTKVMGGWSLGWERRFSFGNRDWFSHGGANTGTGGHIYATMKGGNGIAFFGNGPNGIRIPILDQLRNSIIKSHGWEAPLKDKDKAKPIPAKITSKVVGRYMSVFGEIIKVEEENGKLMIKNMTGIPSRELVFIGNNRFVVEEMIGQIRFLTHPQNGELYIARTRKDVKEIDYAFSKLAKGEKLPNEYLQENNYEKALQSFQKWKRISPRSMIVDEGMINSMGYQELRRKNYELAINIFKINISLYPTSANAHDSLGEAYMLSGEKELSIHHYRKSLELNPANDNAKKMLDKMKK